MNKIYDKNLRQLRRAVDIFGREKDLVCNTLASWGVRLAGLPLTTLSLLLIAGCGGGGQSVGDSSTGTQATGGLPPVAQVLGAGQVASCGAASDCDADGIADDIDIDDDGDGLIEIRTPRQLDMVRYQLEGKGVRQNDRASLDQTGCGNGTSVRRCFGYELVQDISLTDYIARTYPTSGWKPIASDVDPNNNVCDGDQFTAIFEGNGFEISGLSINRPDENCIGLFGQASGTIRDLGLVADRIVGRDYVSSLVGDGAYVKIAQSYGFSDEVRGVRYIGGLVGYGWRSKIARSYAVSNGVKGVHYVGGLVGEGWHTEIIQSYVVSGVVRGNARVGGLVGYGMYPKIIQSYAVSGEISGNNREAGLLESSNATIVESYMVRGAIIPSLSGPMQYGSASSVQVSYWNSETGGMDNATFNDIETQNNTASHSPTRHDDIYNNWGNGAIPEGEKVAGINHDGTVWCDEDFSGAIEANERRDNNRVWDLGTNQGYPAIRCTVDSLADQRARWYTNSTTHEPPPNTDTSPIDVDGSLDNRTLGELGSPSEVSDTEDRSLDNRTLGEWGLPPEESDTEDNSLDNRTLGELGSPSEVSDTEDHSLDNRTLGEWGLPSEVSDARNRSLDNRTFGEWGLPSEVSDTEDRSLDNRTLGEWGSPSEVSDVGNRSLDNRTLGEWGLPPEVSDARNRSLDNRTRGEWGLPSEVSDTEDNSLDNRTRGELGSPSEVSDARNRSLDNRTRGKWGLPSEVSDTEDNSLDNRTLGEWGLPPEVSDARNRSLDNRTLGEWGLPSEVSDVRNRSLDNRTFGEWGLPSEVSDTEDNSLDNRTRGELGSPSEVSDARNRSLDNRTLGEWGLPPEESDSEFSCNSDSDCDRVLDEDEIAGCELLSDCDSDGVLDTVDIDADGDGLIEIRTAAQLDAVRYKLDGSGYKASRYTRVDRTGCGDGAGIRSCSGYELVHNISLTDYIAEVYPVSGWQPIAPSFGSDRYCVGGRYRGVFDGNGFEVSGLYINRPEQSCVGLFGQAKGTIRDLGVVADRVIGKHHTSILLGYGNNIELLRSYGVADEVRGIIATGGLVGFSERSRIVDSFVVAGEVQGTWFTGGLVGETRNSDIVRSYGVIGIVRGADRVGGLVGQNRYTDIVQSFVVSSVVSGSGWVGGLVGRTEGDRVIAQSYVVSGIVFSRSGVGGLLGSVREGDIIDSYAVIGGMREDSHLGGLVGYIEDVGVQASYWDSETSGMSTDNAGGSRSQASIGLRSPTGYTGIYSTWDDGIMLRRVHDISRSDTIWCDEDSSGSIEVDERRNDNRVWDFGSSRDYPALRCTGDSLASQRAWWHLNITTHKPQLNVDAFPIDISPWLDRDRDGVDNIVDNCALMSNADQLDTDNDDVGDVCDRDKDGDGIANGDEVAGCELLSDCDNDSYGDAVDAFPTDSSEWLDSDGDRIGDNADNCPLIPNSDQLDGNNNDVGDVCDEDTADDRDGEVNEEEATDCELVWDCDSDGIADGIDIDADGDGLIEIATARQLDAVRYVLNGSGYKATADATIDQTGCGNGHNRTRCHGYELVDNISLTDYIAEVYPVSGWQPIAHDVDLADYRCPQGQFTGVFEGNGFVISGLWIDRPNQNCIGLFGRASGEIRHLGVEADSIVGNNKVGGLVGSGTATEIVQSYVVNGRVRGAKHIGGLVGQSDYTEIVQSYAVNDRVAGNHGVGGLVGESLYVKVVRSYGINGQVYGGDGLSGLIGLGSNTEIIQSYAVSGEVWGGTGLGGLLGRAIDGLNNPNKIIQSYAVNGQVKGYDDVGGLVGSGWGVGILQSFVVSSYVHGVLSAGGLVGSGRNTEVLQSYVIAGLVAMPRWMYNIPTGDNVNAQDSYWDNETNGDYYDANGGSRQVRNRIALRSPTDYTGIYSTWDDGAIDEDARVADVDRDGTIWCDEDLSGSIEADERRNDNRVWDFGSSSDYPALRCITNSLSDQRAWWFLDSRNYPQLNQTRLDDWVDTSLDGSLP